MTVYEELVSYCQRSGFPIPGSAQKGKLGQYVNTGFKMWAKQQPDEVILQTHLRRVTEGTWIIIVWDYPEEFRPILAIIVEKWCLRLAEKRKAYEERKAHEEQVISLQESVAAPVPSPEKKIRKKIPKPIYSGKK